MKLNNLRSKLIDKKLKYIGINLFFILFCIVTQAQNYVSSGSEIVFVGSVDFSTSPSWETSNASAPGFYTWVNTAENYSGASDEHHINGYVKKIGSQGFTFPVGSGTDLRTLQISAPTSSTSEYAVAWLVGNPGTTPDPTNSNQLHATTAVSGTIMAVSPAGQWDWVPVDGTGEGLTVTVSIPALSGDSFTSAADVRLVGWNGSAWVNLGTSGASGLTENSTLSGTMIAGIEAIGIGVVSNVLSQIGNEGDSPNTVPSIVTVAQINTISPAIIGAIVANQAAYQAYIDANPGLFSSPATAAEVQAMVTAVNALVVRVIAAPVFTVVQNADGTLTVSGTAEKDGTVTITFPDGSTQLVTVNSQGTFGPITSLLPQSLKGEVKAVVVSAAGVSSVPASVPYETIINVSVSEAFTPNGDGINDTWQILDLDKFPNTTVRVYNRWGHLVFSSKNYQNDWAGNYKDFNSVLPESSSYYYQIDYGSDGSVDKEGWLYIRK